MLVIVLKAVEINWFPFTYILDNLITNSIHAWLTKDYRSSGMQSAQFTNHLIEKCQEEISKPGH